MVWARGTSPPSGARGWPEEHSLTLDPIVSYSWQGGRMLWLIPLGRGKQGCLERGKPSRHPQLGGPNLSP